MGGSNEEILKNIRYYQQSVDKYASLGNNYKLMSIIEKLKRIPITTSHLEETGIGRTINALRKLGGDVGDAAKALVARWKEMVLLEDKKEDPVEAANTTSESEKDADSHEEKNNSCREEEGTYYEKQKSFSHRLSDIERKKSEKHEKDKNKYSSNNISGSSHEKKEKYGNKESISKKRKLESDDSGEEHSSKRQHDSSDNNSDRDINDRRSSKLKKKSNTSEEEEEEDDRKHRSKKSRSNKDSDSEDGSKKHKRSSKSSHSHSSNKSKSSHKTEPKMRRYDSSSDVEESKSKSKHRSSSKSKRSSDCDEAKSSSKHKSRKSYESSSDNEEIRHKSKHDKEPSKSKSHSDRHEKKDSKDARREETKEKHSHRKDEPRKHEELHKNSKDEKDHRKEKSSNSSKLEGTSSSSSSKNKSSSEKRTKDKVKLPKPVNTEKIMNGIDSGSGASFAEALGMCGPVVTTKPSSNKKKSSSSTSSEKPRSSSSYVKQMQHTETAEEEIIPSLLVEQPPEPLNINISSLLPDITPTYRPLGFSVDLQPKRVLSQDEALSQVISNKNMRTKVYSGNKSIGKVDSLFTLCVRILQEHIDALEYTGGVPYHILKPVLEKATPDQLFNMEHHNPYLIEETDELWQLHCQKEFRNKKREELESWREMYMRCLDEREARLNAITANIKHAQDKSTPVRTTKLAYIDSVVKPPRNIARKQAKNGIVFDKKPAQTPASRVAALASTGDTGKVAVPNPHRAVDRSSGSTSSSSAAMKPKKAPLMAKTLSFLKNRFRR